MTALQEIIALLPQLSVQERNTLVELLVPTPQLVDLDTMVAQTMAAHPGPHASQLLATAAKNRELVVERGQD